MSSTSALDTVNALKTRSPLRVFIIFAIGIILPGGFLSFLGFRSIQYESMLIQKQAEEHYSAVADLMQKKAEEEFTSLLNALRGVTRAESPHPWTMPTLTAQVLSLSRLGDVPVQKAFVFDAQGQLVIPGKSGGSDPTASSRSPEVNWGLLRDEVDRLEHLEFIDKNVAQAVQGYQALRAQTSKPDLQAILLKNMAGGYRKLHQTHEAESSYLELIRLYDQVPDVSGYPMGVLARQLLAKFYLETQRPERALDVKLDLMEGMTHDAWKMDPSQRHLLLEELGPSIEQGMKDLSLGSGELRARWDRIRAIRSRLQQIQPSAQAFAKADWPNLFQRLRSRGWLDTGGVLELSGHTTERDLAVVSPLSLSGNDQPALFLVAIVPGHPIWPRLENLLVELAQPVGLQVDWVDGTTPPAPVNQSTVSLWKARLERQVSTIDPRLQLRFTEPLSKEKDALERRRIWVYGGIVGLSFIVILVGLVVMGQAVKRETEIANLKAEFVANVSHELRTPLATISYIGERLSLGRYRSEGERTEFYGMLGEETHRLRDLVEDVLDFSKMLAGKKVYGKEALNLVDLIQDANKQIRGKAEAKGFEVVLSLSHPYIPIRGDRRAIVQALLNVLDNALKYSGTSRRIRVSLQQTYGQAAVEVQDYGIGISASDQEKIFEKFYRVEQALGRESEGGVGLGLAMVKHVMEGHAGSVQVESQPGSGSVFRLWFPIYREAMNRSVLK